MAEETSASRVDGSPINNHHVDDADASNGPAGDVSVNVDGQVNVCAHFPPFLIGVAGGTAAGKVCLHYM